MARPINHITTIISDDPEKTYRELLKPPKPNPARDKMVQRVKAFEIERLAEEAHNAWSGWMRYLFEKSITNDDGTCTIPVWAVERWTRQMNTPYADLPESEKESDRTEAKRYLGAKINVVEK